MSYNININGKMHRADCDIVIVIELRCWPHDVAESWLKRDRRWPDEAKVMEIVSDGCYVVARDSRDVKERTRWQLTFFNAEIKLASLRTDEQKTAYLLAKSVYYKCVMPLNDDKQRPSDESVSSETRLSSYFLKTVMMWTCEDHPPDDEFWNKDHTNEAASHLLNRLAGSLRAGYLESYFLPKMNLLKNVSDQRQQIAFECLTKINSRYSSSAISNPAAELADVVDEVLDRTAEMMRLAKLIDPFINFGADWTSFKLICKLLKADVEQNTSSKNFRNDIELD